jgi:hypothetical protein
MKDKELREKWPAIKTKIQELHPEMSEEDLRLEIGKEAELLLRLQEKLRKNKDEIDNWLSVMG